MGACRIIDRMISIHLYDAEGLHLRAVISHQFVSGVMLEKIAVSFPQEVVS